jgi:RNA polymerase sigma factor (sigma-70 family)
MAAKALNGVFHRLRALAAVHTSRACNDRELLERFLTAEDEAAFTLLVERHGPMILGLCRRLLRDRHEADDACQATFLVLARKARTVRKQESLASWLHGVAYRVSISLRRQRARRVRREQSACKTPVQEPDDGLTWRELRPVLDEELQRLPERYRAPLILCYLEGKTRDEAAQELGAKPAALHGLLDRGRKMLRDRLTRRGLTLSAVLFTTALTDIAARAALAPGLVVTSAQAALALLRGATIGEGLVGPHILSLVKEASKTMFMTKLKIGAALVVAASILTGIVGGSLNSIGLAQDANPAQPKATSGTTPPKTESDEEFIRRISKDLRGVDPSPTEVHFFVANKDANRRQKLIDLFIQERQAKEQAAVSKRDTLVMAQIMNVPQAIDYLYSPRLAVWDVGQPQIAVRRRLAVLQSELFKDLNTAAKDKKEVAAITQKYLDQLQEYVKAHPQNDDVADAMQQISLIYRSQGKTVEADAWRAKLLKEHPQSPAAKAAQQTSSASPQIWVEYFNDYPFPMRTVTAAPWTTNSQPYLYNPYVNTVPWTTISPPNVSNTLLFDRSTLQPYLTQPAQQPAPKKSEDKQK